jgi:hypothetical protein
MTPEERATIDAAMNEWMRHALTDVLVLLTIVACFWLAWQRWGHLVRGWLSTISWPAYVARGDRFPRDTQSPGNPSSYAPEPPPEPPRPELVPTDRELAITLDDLLTELALLSYIDRDGEVKQFSATRIADFIGGRKQDTLEAVRLARGEAPAELADGIKVRDHQGERVIAPLRTKARA